MMMLSGAEKKLIQIFKTFVEKAFVPQIKKLEGSLVQWNKFSSMLLADSPSYNEMQLFVDSMPIWGNNNVIKKVESDPTQTRNFQPSKSFGSKTNNYQFIQSQATESKQNDSLRQRVSQNNSNSILSNLQKLLRSFEQNQSIIEGLAKDSQPQVRRDRESVSSYSTNGNIQMSTQSYNYLPQNQPQMLPNPPMQSLSQPQLQSGSTGILNYHKAYY